MTYWEYDEAVARFQRVLEALGIRQALITPARRTATPFTSENTS